MQRCIHKVFIVVQFSKVHVERLFVCLLVKFAIPLYFGATTGKGRIYGTQSEQWAVGHH